MRASARPANPLTWVLNISLPDPVDYPVRGPNVTALSVRHIVPELFDEVNPVPKPGRSAGTKPLPDLVLGVPVSGPDPPWRGATSTR